MKRRQNIRPAYTRACDFLLVQFRPDEPLAAYFDDLGLDMIFDTEDGVSELLRSRGL